MGRGGIFRERRDFWGEKGVLGRGVFFWDVRASLNEEFIKMKSFSRNECVPYATGFPFRRIF